MSPVLSWARKWSPVWWLGHLMLEMLPVGPLWPLCCEPSCTYCLLASLLFPSRWS